MKHKHPLAAFFFSLLLFPLLASTGIAQIRTVWSETVDGGVDDAGYHVGYDSLGNVITTGWVFDALTDYDVFVAKHDPSGQLLWSLSYDSPDHLEEHATDLVVDASDDIYVSGVSEGAGTGMDFLMLKFSSAGGLLWAQRHDGPVSGDDWVQLFGPLAVDGSGSAYLTGYTTTGPGQRQITTVKFLADGTKEWVRDTPGPNPASTASAGESLQLAPSGALYVAASSRNVAGNSDYTLLKYDGGGTLQWERQFDGVYGLDETLYGLAIDASENIYLTGLSDTTGGFEYCVAKFDSSGNFLWEGRYGGVSGYHYGWVIDVDDLGNAYVTGASMSTGGEYNIVTVKFDTNGVLQWARRYSTPFFGEDWGRDIEVGPDGNIYVTGYVWQWFSAGHDMVTFKYDPSGNLLWEMRHAGSAAGNDAGFGLRVDDELNVLVAGISVENGSGADVLTVKYSQSPPPSLAVSPDPLLAGQIGTFSAIDFEPGVLTYLAYGLNGLGSTSVPFLKVTLGIAQPTQAGAALPSDGNGAVDWNLMIPGNAGGTAVWFQAAQYNQATNVVATTVQ